MALYELGDIGFSYFHEREIHGVRKHLHLDIADDDVEVDAKAIFEKLKNHFAGKLLLDMRYCEVWNDFGSDKLEFWYENGPVFGATCIILEKEKGTVFIQDLEAILEDGFNKDFSAVAGYRVIMSRGHFDAEVTAVPFNCMSGILNGHSPRMRITKNGEFDLDLSIRFANTLDGVLFTDEAYLLYDSVDDAPKADFRGFISAHYRENSKYARHHGTYINKGNERLVLSEFDNTFIVGDEVTAENIAKVLMSIWGKRDWNKDYVPLLGCEVEILDF